MNPQATSGSNTCRRIVADQDAADATFRGRCVRVASAALDSRVPALVRRAVQVCAALGLTDALPAIRALRQHSEPMVASDSKAAAFILSRT